MPSEVWNPSLIFHQLSPRLALKHSPPESTPWYLTLNSCTAATNVVQLGVLQLAESGGWGKIVFCLFGLGSPSPQSLSLPFLPCEDAWDLQMGKQGISSKGGRHLQSRASGVPRALRGVQREDSFPHSWLFPKEGGKGDKRGEKRSGDSLCICVQYGLFWFFILHSEGLPRDSHLLQTRLYLPACVKVAQLLPRMRGADHIYLPGIRWARGRQGSYPTWSAKAGLERKADLAHCRPFFVLDSGGQRLFHIPAYSVRQEERSRVQAEVSISLWTKMQDD